MGGATENNPMNCFHVSDKLENTAFPLEGKVDFAKQKTDEVLSQRDVICRA